MKRIIFMGITIMAIFVSSCKKEVVQAPEVVTQIKQPNKSKIEYEDLEILLKTGLNKIGENLRCKKTTFNSKNDVIAAAKQYFKNSPEAYEAFLKAYNGNSTNSDAGKLETNAFIDSVINDIEIERITSESPEKFISFLQTEFEQVVKSEVQFDNKELLLEYIISYKVAIEFISHNLDIVGDSYGQNKAPGWWDSWGKCAAGIIGGAGLGGLTGAAAASVIPGIGTVAGGVIGGISGALTGAATAC